MLTWLMGLCTNSPIESLTLTYRGAAAIHAAAPHFLHIFLVEIKTNYRGLNQRVDRDEDNRERTMCKRDHAML